MIAYGLPVLATLALWWGSTGLILHLDSQDSRTFVGSMLGASALLALCLWLVVTTSDETTPASAYVAFACGIVLWGGQLLAFYTGFVTGPNKTAYCADAGHPSRFFQAVNASLYHELAAAAGALLLFAMTYGQENMFALWTYLILWLMHESAKLNVFLGVPNLGEDLLPDHLAYFATFMKRKPMNALFPLSVTAGTIAACLLIEPALRADASSFEMAGFTMLGALMALAVVEHWFLVAPIDANAIWRGFHKTSSGNALESALQVELALAEGHQQGATPGVAPTRDERRNQPHSAYAWSTDPPAVCDARNIELLLELIATGSFGEVDCIQGLVRTKADWVCFELSGGRASIAPFAPRRMHKSLVIARGRGFDRVRLQAAFDGCAALA
jgi:putative photosynthetic complex assembly protein 2